LTRTEVREYFRPNLWPNTPDILTEILQVGGRPAFMSRLVLAATLGASYGLYGPAYELCENVPMAPGKEEYLNSEKYEIKHWDINRPDSLAPLMATINRIRRENPALQTNDGLTFHGTGNDLLIAYSKVTPDQSNALLIVVNLDPVHVQSGMVDLPLDALGLDPGHPYEVDDLLTGSRYVWNGPRNYVELNPDVLPAHILRIARNVRREHDYDYYV
jgi:starch synthase (maltosyl-transferring)